MEIMLCCIAHYVYVVLLYFFVCQLVPGAIPFWKMILILPTINIVTGLKMLCYELVGTVFVGGFIVASMVIYAFLFFREQRGQVLLYSAIFLGMKMVSSAVAYRVVVSVVGNDSKYFTAGQMLICTILGWSIFILLGATYVMIFRTISMKSLHSLYLLYLLFPFSQTILVVWSVLGISVMTSTITLLLFANCYCRGSGRSRNRWCMSYPTGSTTFRSAKALGKKKLSWC